MTNSEAKLNSVVAHNCYYCGISSFEQGFHRDHVIPKARGGKGGINNIVMCCAGCNRAKKNRTPEEYREYITESITRDISSAVGRMIARRRFFTDEEIRHVENTCTGLVEFLDSIEVSFHHEAQGED